MSERITSAKIVSQNGLDTSRNFLQLGEISPGSATMLQNYESSIYGGYRRIDGFEKFSTIVPGEGPVLGVAIFGSTIIAARKDIGVETYSFYRSDLGLPWDKLNTGFSQMSTGVIKVRYVTYNFNGTDKIMFVDGINAPIIFDGSIWSQPSGDQLDPLAGNPKYITLFKNHIFLGGFGSASHVVIHSAPLDDLDFKAASGAGQIIAGYDVVQIKPFRESLFVFGFNDIKKVTPNQTTFVLNDVTANIGCIAPDSVVEIGGDLVFLSQDGIRPISATERIGDIELGSISKQIQSVLIEYIKNFSSNFINAVAVRNKSQIRFLFSANSPDRLGSLGVLGCLTDNAESVSWEWSTLKGIRAYCTISDYIGREEFVLHGDFDGFVYRQEVGNSFDNNPIPFIYQTPFLDFGDTRVRKTIRSTTLFTRPEGPLTLGLSVSYNWGDVYSINPSGYVMESSGNLSIYGTTVTYGQNFTYGSITSPVLLNNIQGSCYSMQITISGQDTNPSHSIQGFVFELSTDGRI